MKLIVGLGNPGKEYEGTRHNAGFMVVESLNSKFKFSKKFGAEVAEVDWALFVKPQLFMNRSGEVVAKIMQFYKIAKEDLIVIHDDLDIKLGDYKISNRGPKVHNGVNSIREKIGDEGFTYVRIGVDNREQLGYRIQGVEYVLQKFSEEEKDVLDKVIKKVVDEIFV